VLCAAKLVVVDDAANGLAIDDAFGTVANGFSEVVLPIDFAPKRVSPRFGAEFTVLVAEESTEDSSERPESIELGLSKRTALKDRMLPSFLLHAFLRQDQMYNRRS
jgi:hypothetical protein